MHLFGIPADSSRGQKDKGGIAKLRVFLDLSPEHGAVHMGHIHVENGDAERILGLSRLAKFGQGFRSIGGYIVQTSPGTQLFRKDKAVRGVIVHGQNALAPDILGNDRFAFPVPSLFSEYGREPEGGSLALLANNADLTPHEFRKPFGNAQAEAGPAISPGGGRVDL